MNTKTVEKDSDEVVEVKKDGVMDKLLNASANPPSVDDVIEGKVIGIEKSAVYIDIPPFGTGIIFGREYINARDIIKKINVGDMVAGKVVSLSNKEGYIEISLKEARQALIWSEAEDAINKKTILDLPVLEANKGGLIIAWQGISGFLPASQLKTEHYPRVNDGDKDKILEDSHDQAVWDESWQLYQYVIERLGPIPTIIERTGNIPQFDSLIQEVARARRIQESIGSRKLAA